MKLKGSRAADAHLRYLQRDGVTRDGEPGRVYSAIQDRADGEAFVRRGREDRHQFRFIVAPEDGAELGSLPAFTRSLMDQMEQDLGTRLDWVAVDHHNTGHPHSHVVVRGVTEDGKILNIAGDYIAHGIRARASEIVTLELGPQSEREVQQKLRHEVEEDRFTRLDAALLKEVNDEGRIDLRPGAEQSYLGRANRYLLIDRLKKPERLDLAHEAEPGRWSLSSRNSAGTNGPRPCRRLRRRAAVWFATGRQSSCVNRLFFSTWAACASTSPHLSHDSHLRAIRRAAQKRA